MDSRANIKVERSTRDRLRDHKPDDQSWDEFLNGLLDDAPVVAENVELTEEQARVLVRKVGDEVEERMTR